MLQPYAQPRSEDSVGDWVENLFFTDKNVFLYKKFDLQPYTWRHGLFLLSSIALMLLIYMIPTTNNFVLNILIKSFAFGIAFYGLAYWINPAPEILNFFNDLIKNKIPGFFKRKS